ncbi:MAG: REP-associated tyrosine transposase [Haloferula sp.]
MGSKSSSKGWYRRGYHPHLDLANRTQGITFRLADSVPRKLIEKWKRELIASPDEIRANQLRRLIASYEDAGRGQCWLRDPRNAQLVVDALTHFDRERYDLIEWCVMPNHVHVLVVIREGFLMSEMVRSWKSYTARLINQNLGQSGQVWARNYHDRLIRDTEHLERARRYILMNPVKAGLSKTPEDWQWSSARSD